MAKRRERTQATIDRMMDAAAACFTEKGFEGCSISDIAAKAGMSQGSFYVHFANKEALFKAIIVKEYSQTIERINAIVPKEITPGRLADLLLDELLGSEQCFDPRLYMEVVAMAARDASIREAFIEYDQAMGEAVARLLGKVSARSGKSSNRDYAAVAQWLTIFMDGLLTRTVMGGMRNRAEQRKVLVDFLTYGLALVPPP